MTDEPKEPLVVGLTLGPRPDSARRAREFVADTLRAWAASSMIDDAELLTSELVTNALLHTRRSFSLTVLLDDRHLRVAVADSSRRPPWRRKQTSPLDDVGRGLQVVDALCSAWGVDLIMGGKAVWFELTSFAVGATSNPERIA